MRTHGADANPRGGMPTHAALSPHKLESQDVAAQGCMLWVMRAPLPLVADTRGGMADGAVG